VKYHLETSHKEGVTRRNDGSHGIATLVAELSLCRTLAYEFGSLEEEAAK
jgi:hypothetical protein